MSSAVQVHDQRPSLARRLRSVADQGAVSFRSQWLAWLIAARTRLRASTAVPKAVASSNTLEIGTLAHTIWHQAVEVPARRELPSLSAALLAEAATVSVARVRRLVGHRLTFVEGTPEVEQWLGQYLGAQIRDITATTMRTMQQVAHDGLQEGWSVPVRARAIRDSFGLTPRQQQTIALLADRLTRQGKHVRQVAQYVKQATDQALRLRATQIGATESYSVVNAGMYFVLAQATQQAPMAPEQLRRTWEIYPDACPQICAPIPAMNPGGVGLGETFQTPIGPVLFPPLHPNCRCTCDVEIIPG